MGNEKIPGGNEIEPEPLRYNLLSGVLIFFLLIVLAALGVAVISRYARIPQPPVTAQPGEPSFRVLPGVNPAATGKAPIPSTRNR